MALTDLAGRLDRAVLYQIYPQSFADSNGDGIGDLPGIIDRLDYLAWLGVDAIWLSPCFVSPFRDAGYDVADFCDIAPRYGTTADLERLTEAAGRRGIAVLLDLVAGHTSDQHPWFRAAQDDPGDDRFVWSADPHPGMQPGTGRRGGYYLPNFFPCQPALNFGYARPDPAQPWRSPVDGPGPLANRAALRDIMTFWFDRGVAGFRVDMAASLVKDDPGLVETSRLWAEMRTWLDRTHPGRVLISEWGDPRRAVPAGFHADFFLQFGGDGDGHALRSLWDNAGASPCWADAAGQGSAADFVTQWRAATDAIAAGPEGHRGGVTGLPTANHDFNRLVSGSRDADQARAALTFVLTWPSMPSLYQGDEIGMRYLPDTPSIEGSRLSPDFDRAGSRTPMQWGPPSELPPLAGALSGQSRYLPEDPDPYRPTVAAQVGDPASLLHHTRELVALRHRDRRLDVGSSVEVLNAGYPLAYLRGGSLAVVTNPSGTVVTQTIPGAAAATVLLGRGMSVRGDELRVDAHGYAVLDLAPAR